MNFVTMVTVFLFLKLHFLFLQFNYFFDCCRNVADKTKEESTLLRQFFLLSEVIKQRLTKTAF